VVRVPALPSGRSWVVRPIHARCSGQTIDFAPAAVLQAKRGRYHKYQHEYWLFSMTNVSDVTVLGNGGATFRMWRADYGNASLYNHSEGRHGIALFGSRNILLDGITVTETGGDGVYVSNPFGHVGAPCRNVTVRNCNLTGNYRNAMSVISADGLTVEHTTLALSQGTPPEGGIDLEPNSPVNMLRHILVDNVTIHGNTQRGVTLSGHALRDNTSYTPVSIVVRNTRISGGTFGISINASPKGLPAGSSLTLQGLTVSNTSGSGLLMEDKTPNLLTTVQDSVFKDVAATGGQPLWIEGRNAPCHGTTFTNVTVIDDRDRAAVLFMADVEGMAGTITVHRPGCTEEAAPPGNTLVISCAD